MIAVLVGVFDAKSADFLLRYDMALKFIDRDGGERHKMWKQLFAAKRE